MTQGKLLAISGLGTILLASLLIAKYVELRKAIQNNNPPGPVATRNELAQEKDY